MKTKVLLLRIVHGLFSLYFIACIGYLYYSVIYFKPALLLAVSVISLGIEGIVVFILNKGDCPLIHIQRRIGDDIPFFALFLPRKLAKGAIPLFAAFALLAAVLLLIRYVYSGV